MKKKKAVCIFIMAVMLCGTSVVTAEEAAQEGKNVQSGSTESEKSMNEDDIAQDKNPEQAGETDQTEDAQLAEGQRKATVKVVSITGNELTYYEVPEETEDSNTTASREQSESEEENPPLEQSEDSEKNGNTDNNQAENAAPDQPESGEQPDNFDPEQMGNGEQPGNFDPSKMGNGEQSGDFNPDQMRNGEKPEGVDRGQMRGSRSGNSDSGQPEDGYSFQGRGSKSGRMNQETKTVYLPVSVVVHTDTDAEMTFSILKAGDELEVLFEENEDGEEMITEIWLMSTESETV